MVCRRLHVVAAGLLAVAGCTYPFARMRTEPPTEARQPDEPSVKANTWIAFGDFRTSAAFAPESTPAQQQQFREDAKLAYLKAIEIDPNRTAAYLGLGRLQQMSGENEGAQAVYERALKVQPNEPRLWFELGMCHCRAKNWSTALEGLGKAAELDPGNRQYSTTLGFALARAGRYEESYVALARHNGEPKAHYDLARMLCHLNQPELARQQLTLALQKDPSMAQARALAAELDAKRTSKKEDIQTAGHSETSGANGQGGKPGPRNLGRPIRLPPLPVIARQTDEE
jgi:tetratricopeptide (TPR) repeat protein